MITKEQLKDWLDESARKKYESQLEKFIDNEIRENALQGETTFFVATGKWGRTHSEKTPFYDIWHTDQLSKENREIVQQRVINKYRAFGFNVEESRVDCGWNNHFFALKFSDIHKVVEG